MLRIASILSVDYVSILKPVQWVVPPCVHDVMILTSLIFSRPVPLRPVGARGVGGAMVPPDFARSANPISTSRTDYTLHIDTAPPLRIFRPSYGPARVVVLVSPRLW